MESMATWEIILAGLLMLLIVFWFRPGIKHAVAQSREAPKDWSSALLALGAVVLFVVLLMALV